MSDWPIRLLGGIYRLHNRCLLKAEGEGCLCVCCAACEVTHSRGTLSACNILILWAYYNVLSQILKFLLEGARHVCEGIAPSSKGASSNKRCSIPPLSKACCTRINLPLVSQDSGGARERILCSSMLNWDFTDEKVNYSCTSKLSCVSLNISCFRKFIPPLKSKVTDCCCNWLLSNWGTNRLRGEAGFWLSLTRVPGSRK